MLQFLVLGIIPGTHIQISFDMIVDILAVVLVIVYTPRVLRYAEQRKHSVQQ